MYQAVFVLALVEGSSSSARPSQSSSRSSASHTSVLPGSRRALVSSQSVENVLYPLGWLHFDTLVVATPYPSPSASR
jgi:hypothetical protein